MPLSPSIHRQMTRDDFFPLLIINKLNVNEDACRALDSDGVYDFIVSNLYLRRNAHQFSPEAWDALTFPAVRAVLTEFSALTNQALLFSPVTWNFLKNPKSLLLLRDNLLSINDVLSLSVDASEALANKFVRTAIINRELPKEWVLNLDNSNARKNLIYIIRSEVLCSLIIEGLVQREQMLALTSNVLMDLEEQLIEESSTLIINGRLNSDEFFRITGQEIMHPMAAAVPTAIPADEGAVGSAILTSARWYDPSTTSMVSAALLDSNVAPAPRRRHPSPHAFFSIQSGQQTTEMQEITRRPSPMRRENER